MTRREGYENAAICPEGENVNQWVAIHSIPPLPASLTCSALFLQRYQPLVWCSSGEVHELFVPFHVCRCKVRIVLLPHR